MHWIESRHCQNTAAGRVTYWAIDEVAMAVREMRNKIVCHDEEDNRSKVAYTRRETVYIYLYISIYQYLYISSSISLPCISDFNLVLKNITTESIPARILFSSLLKTYWIRTKWILDSDQITERTIGSLRIGNRRRSAESSTRTHTQFSSTSSRPLT